MAAPSFDIGDRVQVRPDAKEYLESKVFKPYPPFMEGLRIIGSQVGVVTGFSVNKRYLVVDFGKASIEADQILGNMVWNSDLLVPAIEVQKRVLHDSCPKCNDRGEWRAMALVCRNGHGVFAG